MNAIAKPSSILVTTEARGLSGYQTPAERASQDETMAVARSQPHRAPILDSSGGMVANSDDRRLESALGRFCASRKPKPAGEHCYHAGLKYAEIIREYKNAMGFDTPGRGDGNGIIPTDEQIEARKELAVMRKQASDCVLLGLMPRLPRAMERLCYDEMAPYLCDEALIVDGLVLLADKYGFTPRNIRDE